MDELRQLAERIAAIEDEDVIDFADVIARLYRAERMVATGLLACDGVEGGENHPMLAACGGRLRARMVALLEWSAKTGRG
ncbi:MAG: hypothetical protein K2W96_23565 [Gemmataceae bacterium]|nr:hypothetical protein [Gemmataceae bacterium]